MTTHQMAELRKWRRMKDGCIACYVHDDPMDIYEDGEYAVVGPFDSCTESVNFFVFSKGKISFKAMKDEEKPPE